jgi:hypothetical protein
VWGSRSLWASTGSFNPTHDIWKLTPPPPLARAGGGHAGEQGDNTAAAAAAATVEAASGKGGQHCGSSSSNKHCTWMVYVYHRETVVVNSWKAA